MKKENINYEIYKYYYEYWENANWNTNTLSNLSTPDLDVQTIRKGAMTYAKQKLHITPKEFYETLTISRKRLNGINDITNTTFTTLEKLSDTNNEKEIINIISSSKLDIDYLKSKINIYAATYRKKEKEKIINDLKNKINLYKQYKENNKTQTKQTPQEQELKTAHRIILSFSINQDISKEDFCENHDITSKEFESYLKIVKEMDGVTYSMFINKIEHLKDKEKEKLLTNIPLIIKTLKNDNNNFNLLDYYLITTTNLAEFQELAQKLLKQNKITKNEYKILEIFISINKLTKECTSRDIKFLINEKVIVKPEIDEEGRYIENTGTEITPKEKQAILETLKEKSIPISRKVFHQAIQKYANNQLKPKIK